MNFLKKAVASLLILGAISQAGTFEQNGVKEGNSKISISFLGAIDDDDKTATTFQAQYGYFFNNNLELFVKIDGNTREMLNNLKIYTTGIGGNFYFLKTPTLTPYIGANVYYYNYEVDIKDKDTNQKRKVDNSLNGGEVHIGTHYFLNENTAVTPEVGIHYLDFEEYSQSYLNISLSYMF